MNFSLGYIFLLLITSTFKWDIEITVLIRVNCRTLCKISEVLKTHYHGIYVRSSLYDNKYYKRAKTDLLSKLILFSAKLEMTYTNSL